MGFCKILLWFCFSWNLLNLVTSQLQASEAQVLLQLKKHLEYPKQLETWYDHKTNFCYLPPTTQMNISCDFNSITELNIIGDKSFRKVENFDGFSISNLTLSEKFSIDSFVTTLARLKSLKVLTLVSLGIWGPLPEKLHRLSSLEKLDLSSNFLFGKIPPKLSRLVKLQTFELDDNFFNGTFPTWLNSFSNLTVLNLKNNELTGNFPVSLFSLPSIAYLNLASNSLSGLIPNDVTCGSKLEFVDISNNKFTGELPGCLSNKVPETRVVESDGNCLSMIKHQQHPISYCTKEVRAEVETDSKQTKGKEKKRVSAGLIVGIIIAILALLIGLLILLRRVCRSGAAEKHLLHKAVPDNSAVGFSSEIITNARFISETNKFASQNLPACRSYSLEEITNATNNFDSSAIMGGGSYGTLYNGRLENGTQVAIRCLPSSKKYSIRNLKLRLDLLAKLRHPNLVCLLGHCIDCGGRDDYSVDKVFLVYEFVPNGNFRTLLSENGRENGLNWSERLNILVGVAKAVNFLHTGVIPGFFSNRLKTTNVLLNEHRFAKLSDYGLSIVSEATRDSAGRHENPKSWQTARLEDDVYSFGLILLESIIGPSASARNEAFLRDELTFLESKEGRGRMVNPRVLSTASEESLSRVITMMNKCLSPESLSRPSFEDVLWNLQYAAQLQDTS